MTEFNVGATYHGFTLERTEYIEEINSNVFLFTHTILGTPVFAIKNSDANKTFCIAFETIPQDSTGVAHILEHSVLMGSQKYPVKDVFGEINKGGLMTFLNAMTGSDTTWYPFATRNSKEYFHIMDVYCDVTLHPLLLRSTFEQEGWHYHKERADKPLQIQGVVYNEMKGAFSDPFRHLFHHTFKGLMPGSTYAHESGGDPENIPDLTYEQFIAFHKKYYHPSNSTLFFYGDADLETELAYVQENFLSHFDAPGEKAEITIGETCNGPIFINESYGVQPGSDLQGKTFLAVGSLTGDILQRKQNISLQIIANILYNSDASPLKNAIISSGLCSDFGGLYVTGSSFKTFMLTYVIGCDEDKRDRFLKIYNESLAELVSQGLHQDLVLAELNKYEFSVREEMNKAQRGLDLINKALPAMKYGADPFDALKMEYIFKEIRSQALDEGYFEHLIDTLLIDNKATAVITLQPDPEKMSKGVCAERERLALHEERIGQDGIYQLVQRTETLMRLQLTPNTEETLALLPCLKRDDLNAEVQFFEAEAEDLGGQTLIVSELDTNGISYIDFGFDCTSLQSELLLYLDLFGTIVTEIGTDDLDFRAFAKLVNTCTGGFAHFFSTYQKKNQTNTLKPILWFQIKVLSSFLDEGLELVYRILSQVSFHDRQRIRDIVQREYAWAEHSIQSEGYSLASTRVFSHLSLAGKYNELVNGASAYLQLKELALHFDQHADEFVRILESLRQQLLVRKRLVVSITSRKTDIIHFKDRLPALMQSLPEGVLTDTHPSFPDLPLKQAFCTSAGVLYNVKGCHLFPDPNRYDGRFEVLKTWLSRDYLWNTVRQQGGAYGCFIHFNQLTGNLAMVSYRDPQIEKTFNAYDNAWQQVQHIEIPDSGLQQLIVGTYGNFDPHQGPPGQGLTARNEFLSGITASFKLQRLKEILSTQQQDLQDFAPFLENMAASSIVASIGNCNKIKEVERLYDSVIEL